MPYIHVDIALSEFTDREVVDYVLHNAPLRAKVEAALTALREQRTHEATLRDWERAAQDGLIHA